LMFFRSTWSRGAPSLASCDPKLGMESVDFDPHLNPVTYLSAHKQGRIEGRPSQRINENLDQLPSWTLRRPGDPRADSYEYI
jgi:hypothetical protein